MVTDHACDRDRRAQRHKSNPGTRSRPSIHTHPRPSAPARRAVAPGCKTHHPAWGAGRGEGGPAWPSVAPSGPVRGLRPQKSLCATGEAPTALSSPQNTLKLSKKENLKKKKKVRYHDPSQASQSERETQEISSMVGEASYQPQPTYGASQTQGFRFGVLFCWPQTQAGHQVPVPWVA